VTPLAGNVGNHRFLVDPLIAAAGELRHMTAKAGADGVGRRHASMWCHAERSGFRFVAGRERQRAVDGVVCEPMLEYRRNLRVDHAHERRAVAARPKRVLGDAFLDLVLYLASDVERSVAESIAPVDIRQLGIRNIGSV
jgi:hypothetical protein